MLPKLFSSKRRTATIGVVAVALAVALLASPLVDWARQQWFGREPEPGVKLTFTATAYCKGTTTASGVAVRRGIAAADPGVLPAGSVVSLSTGIGDFDGVYTVMDTGPLVKGRRLDLYVWSCHEALAFGRKSVQVEVLRLGWDPRASAATLVDRLFRRQNARRTPRRDTPPNPPPEEAPTATPPADAVPVGDAHTNASDEPQGPGPASEPAESAAPEAPVPLELPG
jgi:3D (Asp-Asp-Asp) domain-containing protein